VIADLVVCLLFRPPSPSGKSVKYCSHCVCLSVHSHVSKTTSPNFMKFFLRVTSGYGSHDSAVRCVSSFVDDVMFSHSGAFRDTGH